MGSEGVFLTKHHLNECILRSPWSEYPLPPIHRACRDGDLQSLTYLVIQGDRLAVFRAINEPDQFLMWTPAHWAAYFGKVECIKRLQASGFSLDVLDGRMKQTVAHIAAFAGHAHVLLWLLQNAVSIDKQDSLGETVVHKAARGGSVECLSLLQVYGANMSMPNSRQQFPCDVALSLGHEQCLQYFRAAVPSPSGSTLRASKRSRDEDCNGHGIKRARNGEIEDDSHMVEYTGINNIVELPKAVSNGIPYSNPQNNLIAMMEANGQYPMMQDPELLSGSNGHSNGHTDMNMEDMDTNSSKTLHYPENSWKCLALCGHLQ